jgi:methylthioribose-1-phosphate isomerase
MRTLASSPPPTILWRNESLELLDQTRLPTEVVVHICADVPTTYEAIRTLRVRGAPAIGIAAAYGVCLGAKIQSERVADVREAALAAADCLATSRPTAVNLFWALDRMRECIRSLPDGASVTAFRQALIDEATRIHDEDRQMCHAIGKHGAELLADGSGVLTHCNAGGLATSEFGTALAAIYAAHAAGKRIQVYADETRPLLQGARLTTWELMQAGVPVTLICDSMAAQVMREGRVQAVIVGADRIAAKGDTANKIGTYGVALLAAAHSIPFYVAAPSSTFDLSLETGDAIPIEQRAAEEITAGLGRVTAPVGVQVYNPAFDVTPARLIAAIITERGVIHQPTREKISQLGI